LDQTQTSSLALRRISQLSGGEQQRVLLARALAQDTPIMLLDEPTTHLDLEHQTNLLNLVCQLATEKDLTVLMVLHDLNLAALYADRVAVLVAGRIQAQGTPEEVLTPQTLTSVYNVPVNVISHPEYGTPLVLPEGHQ
jgi:iron complex transport system ATP-binding protein